MTKAERKILVEKEAELWEALMRKQYSALLKTCDRGCGYFAANSVVDEIPAVFATRRAWFHVSALLDALGIPSEHNEASIEIREKYYRYAQGIDAD